MAHNIAVTAPMYDEVMENTEAEIIDLNGTRHQGFVLHKHTYDYLSSRYFMILIETTDDNPPF